MIAVNRLMVFIKHYFLSINWLIFPVKHLMTVIKRLRATINRDNEVVSSQSSPEELSASLGTFIVVANTGTNKPS